MLVITRAKNESVVIGNGITVTVVDVRGDKVRLGVEAPKEMWVLRQEVFDVRYPAGCCLPPTLPPGVEPSWLTPAVVNLARAIAGEKAFDRLPILADALEEGGSNNHDILGHCRSGGVHNPECWVLGLILRPR